jgi:hypothetical protein
MGAIHPAKTELGSTLELIAKRLRTTSEDVARAVHASAWSRLAGNSGWDAVTLRLSAQFPSTLGDRLGRKAAH